MWQVAEEVKRRVEMSGRVVRRMMHIQMANAFDHFRERVEDKKQGSERCRKVVGRLLHLQTARAFDGFAQVRRGMGGRRRMGCGVGERAEGRGVWRG